MSQIQMKYTFSVVEIIFSPKFHGSDSRGRFSDREKFYHRVQNNFRSNYFHHYEINHSISNFGKEINILNIKSFQKW